MRRGFILFGNEGEVKRAGVYALLTLKRYEVIEVAVLGNFFKSYCKFKYGLAVNYLCACFKSGVFDNSALVFGSGGVVLSCGFKSSVGCEYEIIPVNEWCGLLKISIIREDGRLRI